MTGETLLVRKARDVRRQLPEGLRGVIGVLNLLDEIVHRQGTAEAGGAGGGQGVVGAAQIVAQGLRAAAAQEDGARVLHGVQIIEGVVHADLQVLRGHGVCDLNAAGEIVRHDDLAVVLDRGAGDLPALQSGKLGFDLRLHRFGQRLGIRHQHRAGQHVVFGLGQHIRRDKAGVGLAVRQHQHLAGPGDGVDGHLAVDLALGLGHVGVAGTHDLVHPRDGLGAEGHGGHGLGPARLEDPGDARDLRRGEDRGVDPAVLSAGGAHDDLAAAGDLRRHHVHHHRGGVGGGAGGDVKARALDGQHLLPHDHTAGAGEEKAVSQLLFVVLADVALGQTQGVEKLRLGFGHGLVDLRLGHQHGIQLCPVKFLGVFQNRGVAVDSHILQDGGDHAGHVDLGLVALQELTIVELTVAIDPYHASTSSLRARTMSPIRDFLNS